MENKITLDLLRQLGSYITSSHLDRFAEVVEWVLQDDDPDAEDKMNEKGCAGGKTSKPFPDE